MSFLVPGLAFGVVAAVVPIIIHLLNRSRYRVVRWGAMHLLDSVVRVNRRRVRLEQLILLAVRTSIPVLIALFMAKPVLTGWKALPGDVKRSLVVALDDSYSMEVGGEDESGFARAQQALGGITAGLKRGSDVSLVALSGVADPSFAKPMSSASRVREAVSRLNAGFGVADPPIAMEAGLSRFSEMSHADRELLVFTDFQRVSWGAHRGAEFRRLAETLRQMRIQPRLTFFRVGSGETENVSVESLAFSRFVLGVGQRFQVKATVRNHGDAAYAGLRVHFGVDGRDLETSEIALGPRERGQVIFFHEFDTPGSHYLEVMADADPLTADNALQAAVPVWNVVPVLLVNGDPSAEPLQGETDFLEVALEPFTAGGRGLADLIRPRVVRVEALDARALQDTRVVVLANVPSLTPVQVELVEDFVRSGGGLLIFGGDRCDLEWYNKALVRTDGGLLPHRLGEVAGSLTSRDEQTTVVGDHFDHEALALFNVAENGSIAGARVWRWCPLLVPPPSAAETRNSATVLARLASGAPFLAEWRFGEGRGILCATACDADWSQLPLRPFYVPLMQQLTTYLASTVYPPRNVAVGEELALLVPLSKAHTQLTVTLPDGSRRPLKVTQKGPRAVAAFAETRRPGLYVVSGDDLGPVHFVVNTDRSESDLETLTDEEISEAVETLGADLVETTGEYEAILERHQHGREIWRYLFWAALGLIFLELLVEQFFARRRS